MDTKDTKIKGLAKFLGLAKNDSEREQFLRDLLTDNEIKKLHERVRIIAYLSYGASQRDAVEGTKAGITTVSRGARVISDPRNIVSKYVQQVFKTRWWRELFWRFS